MKGLIVLNGAGEIKTALERILGFMAEIKSFSKLNFLWLGGENDFWCRNLFAWKKTLENLFENKCEICMDWMMTENEENLAVHGQCVAKYIKSEAADIVLFYGNMKGKQLGSITAAILHQSCITDVEKVSIEHKEKYFAAYAYRKICSAHLNCIIEFGMETIVIISENGSRMNLSDCMNGSQILWNQKMVCENKTECFLLISKTQKKISNNLSHAKIVFVGGRGLKTEENFERLKKLAKKVGAVCGCTRPVAMAGWGNFSDVIGISGKSLEAELCVTFGVSGSAAFCFGLENVKHIAAINNDVNAPIFLNAHTGIVEDCIKVIEYMENIVHDKEIIPLP